MRAPVRAAPPTDSKPTWQKDTGCARRTDNDVSAVADPNTGVAVYDTFSQGGWLEVGGTSASSPIIASVFALAGTPAAGTYPSSYPYSHTANLFDVTSGSNGVLLAGLPVHRGSRLRRSDRPGHAERHHGVHQRQHDGQHRHGDQPR